MLKRQIFYRLFNNNIKYFSSKPSEDVVNAIVSDIRRGGTIPVFKYAAIYNEKVAIQDSYGDVKYKNLFNAARKLSFEITEKLHGKTQQTITYLCPNDSSHVITQWAIWMSGNIAVPLSPRYPPASLDYFLKDCGSSFTICDTNYVEKLPNHPSVNSDSILCFPADLINKEMQNQDSNGTIKLDGLPNGNFYSNSDAMIMYTSGTTSKPKGVVYGFKQIAAQVLTLQVAWEHNFNDIFLHALPLHHVHGQINSVSSSLSTGATLRMLPYFDAATVWKNLLGMNKNIKGNVSVFMGVPTMYSKLIEEYEKIFSKNLRQIDYIRNYMKSHLRLMISGSAPLPTPVFERWNSISSHRLLERYGMTEIGMALSNVYEPMSDRTPGFVGYTLPGVSAQIATNDPTNGIIPLINLETPPPNLEKNLLKICAQMQSENHTKNLFKDNLENENDDLHCRVTVLEIKAKKPISGDLLIKGPCVFNKFWNRPEQTKSEFTSDGWFKTGDTAIFEDGKVRILGRTSVDIIKSGGYKISALDVETVFLGHESIADIAVLGLPDITWGEIVAAVIEFKHDKSLTLNELQDWGAQYLPKYQLPTKIFTVKSITRNAMGKVNKKELLTTLTKNQ